MVPTIVFAAVGALFMVLAVPMMRRRVPPNRLYGLRTPATLKDERIWYDANAVSGRDVFIIGIVLVVTSLVLPFAAVSPETQAVVQGGLLSTLSVAAAIRGFLLASRMERRSRKVE